MPDVNGKIILSLEVLIPLARDGVLEAEDAEMEYEAARQRMSVDAVDDFLTNNWEEIEEFLEVRGGENHLLVDGSLPEFDLDRIHESSADPSMDSMATMLELASQQLDSFEDGGISDDALLEGSDREEIEARTALDLASAFWSRHGAEIQEQFISITLPDDFFSDPDEDVTP